MSKAVKSIFRVHLLSILVPFVCLLFLNQPGFALNNQLALTDSELNIFSHNNIMFYDPLDCSSKGANIITDSCFKIDGNTEASTQWYAEGCLNTGDCAGGLYFASGRPPKQDNGLRVTRRNTWIYDDTKVDEEFAGMQYIYAENYDYEYNGSNTIMTKNGGNSTRKYYWIVLPTKAYSLGFGDTYVATFEKINEPIYFIVFDTHACEHQYSGGKGKAYCEEAEANPDGVTIGPGFFGAFTKNGGSYGAIVDLLGKLTSFCRINGTGEVLASHNASNANTINGRTSSPSSGSSASTESTRDVTAQDIVNKARELAWPEGDSGNSTTNPTEAFIAAANESGTNPESDDCLNFVQTVIKASGADAGIPTGEYPNPDEYKIVEYMNSSSKWEKIEVNSETGLEPGDILISAVPPNSDGSHGVGKNHIFIYLGNGKVAAANQGKYFARISNLSSEWDPNSNNDAPFKYGNIDYQVFRLGSGGGCTTYEGEYPEYLQSAEPWGSMPYGPGCTYGGCSCGASSLAMLATYLTGQDIFPNDVGDLLGNSVYWKTTGIGAAALDKRVGEVYGFEAEGVTYSSLAEAEQKMRQYLDNGYLLHFSGAGSYPYSSGGHYIGIFGWTGNGDNVMVANSAFNGNAEMSLHEVVYAGAHGGGFSAIKGSSNSSRRPCNIDVCSSKNQNNSNTGDNDILQSVQEIIDLANQNGSTYIYGGNRSIGAFDSMLNNNTPINTDCTGFASLVIYKTYGATSIFSSSSIFGDSHYEEIPRSDVQPGDIFAYTSPQGHGGIVIEASNGVVTKIAETGGTEGRSGSNNNIGYSGPDSFSVKNMNSSNGHFFRWKGN